MQHKYTLHSREQKRERRKVPDLKNESEEVKEKKCCNNDEKRRKPSMKENGRR